MTAPDAIKVGSRGTSVTLVGFLSDLHGERGVCRCCYGRDDTAALPSLGSITPEEWATFTAAIRAAVDEEGLISQTRVRPLIQSIYHKHRGLCYTRARHLGLIELVGKEDSTDRAGRNTDKEQRVYRLAAA